MVWKWRVRLTYNNTVKEPKVAGGIAIETIHKNDASAYAEIQASMNRTDVDIDITRYGSKVPPCPECGREAYPVVENPDIYYCSFGHGKVIA